MALGRIKKNKRWIWKAYDRSSKRTMKLWEKVKPEKRMYYADNWESYKKVIPERQHKISKSETVMIERDNSNKRHRIGRFTRRTKLVSKKDKMVDLTMKLWSYFENLAQKFRLAISI